MPSKSQLAIEYGHRFREQHLDAWVFWVFAGSPARFEQDFWKIADLVQIPGRDDPQADILALVHSWLHDPGNGEWLIIIDNADDDQIFLKSEVASQAPQESGRRGRSSQPLSWYLPQTDNGRVLMTTRYRNVALEFVGEHDIIILDPMDESDALALLDKKIEGLTDRDSECTMKRLVEALEYMPLAIAQAAAYIVRSAQSRPILEYLEQFRKSDDERTKLLERKGGHRRRDWEANSSILITWQISFEHLLRIRPSAADRLSLMSFCDRQGIPKILICHQTRATEALFTTTEDVIHSTGRLVMNNVSGSREDDKFEDDLLTLRDYSFVKIGGEGSYEMHALVQLATRNWLANGNKLDACRLQYFRVLARAFAAVGLDSNNPKLFRVLYPHVKAALSQRCEAEVSSNRAQALRDFATAMYSAGIHASHSTINISDAQNLFKTAQEVLIKILGMNNMDTLINRFHLMSTKEQLAKTYSRQCLWSRAEDLCSAVVKESGMILGLKHITTLQYMESLARTYRDGGKLDKAEGILFNVWEVMKENGAPITRALRLCSSLAEVYRAQHKLEKALSCQEWAVETAKEYLGPADNLTLHHMDEMAEILQGLGRVDEAIALQTQVVERSQRISGVQQFAMCMRRYQLYSMFLDKGLVKEGLENMLQLLPEVTTVFGQDFWLTIAVMLRIAEVLRDLGRFDEAEEMASQIRGGLRGSEENILYHTVETRVRLLYSQGKDTEAMKTGWSLVNQFKELLGPEDPEIVSIIDLLRSIQKDR
ncbi:MAG: hypothetical protein OHK93_002457 [Ramalina farinacea]|uniref:Uncharacterized protein n=1 Tax=Ramalina farinacea TaxID=258253 RepID=A0AA43TX86_9LECA|nr:hypothetical protein [Ramalina farinacea]